jgi:CrcB protein
VTALLVGLGGVCGVMARYGIGKATFHHTDALLWSTVGINIVGSFLLGLLAAENWFSRDVREALGVGFLGGFTTFSTFSVQVVLDVDAGEPWRAGAYLAASVVGGIAAATCGFVLGRKLA